VMFFALNPRLLFFFEILEREVDSQTEISKHFRKLAWSKQKLEFLDFLCYKNTNLNDIWL